MGTKLKNKKNKESIFFYVLKMMLFLLFFNFLGVIFFCLTILDNFFVSNQNEIFQTLYEDIRNIDDFNVNSKEFKDLIDKTRYNNCIIEVYDTNTNTRLYSPYVYDSNVFSSTNSKVIFDSIIGEGENCCYIYNDDAEKYYLINSLNNQNNKYSMLIRESDNIYILVQTSTDSVENYKQLLYKSIIYCFALASTLGIIPAFLLSKNMLKNINSIKNVAKKISENDFSEECKLDKFGEFYELSFYINKMSHSLETQLYEITEKNKILNEDIERRKLLEETQKDFVSNVSHELKTPIAIISGYVEGLKYGLVSSDDEKNEYYETILKECNRMTNIIKQLLNLSTLESGKELIFEQVDLSEMLNVLISKYKVKHKDRIFINSVNDNLIGYCDYDEIERVIINYLDNAIKYSEGQLEIRAFNEGNYVYIGVHNDGHINEEELEKIWDRFYRIDKSHKRNENSTGLGLSIVKAIMQKHKMPFGAKNVNNGVEFYIKIKKNI